MKKSTGITFLTLFIILTCSWQLKLLSNTQWYWHLFQYLPPDQIMPRYIISLLGRIILIIAACGIWQLKNWGRNLALLLFAIHILVLPWKHPPAVLENSMTFFPATAPIYAFIQQFAASEHINVFFLTTISITLWDLVLNGFLIFFFTRKNIAQQFN